MTMQENILKERILNDLRYIEQIEQSAKINGVSFEDQLNFEIAMLSREGSAERSAGGSLEINDENINVEVTTKEPTLKDKLKDFYNNNKTLVWVGSGLLVAGGAYLIFNKGSKSLNGNKKRRKRKKTRLNGIEDDKNGHLDKMTKEYLKEQNLIS